MPLNIDLLVVGAGYAGSVLAERCASQLGWSVFMVEKRDHIGGNAHDEYDSHDILIHKYGPHWFRSNSDRIVEYLSQFTEWHPIEYRILSYTDGQYYKFPINLDTFNALYGRTSSSEEMEQHLKRVRIPIPAPANSEEVIISQVGWDLYRKFFYGYTKKQWQCEPSELDPSVCGRIPVRTNRDDRYFTDKFQALPKAGYHRLFLNLLSHPKIRILLKTDYREILPHVRARHMIYTGPVDCFFENCFGRLPYRSLRFEMEHLNTEYFQKAMQVNYPNEQEFTRIIEAKHATGQRCPSTTIVREYPSGVGDPYYPVPTTANQRLYQQYETLVQALEPQGIHFVGRLATYRYYNMDQVVGMALAEFEKIRTSPPAEMKDFSQAIRR